MTQKKITKEERYNQLLEIAAVKADPELVAFIEHEKDLVKRKNAADRKPTKTQIENEAIKATILEFISDGRIYTSSQIGVGICQSTSKVSALMGQLVKSKQVTMSEVKIPKRGKVKGYQLKTDEIAESTESTEEKEES